MTDDQITDRVFYTILVIGLAVVTTILVGTIVFPRHKPPKFNYPTPPANIQRAMKNGWDCWVELDYNVHGRVIKKEWLCK